MDNRALEKAAEKIYLKIAETGDVTTNQLILLRMYQDTSSADVFKDLTKFINNVFPQNGGTAK